MEFRVAEFREAEVADETLRLRVLVVLESEPDLCDLTSAGKGAADGGSSVSLKRKGGFVGRVGRLFGN